MPSLHPCLLLLLRYLSKSTGQCGLGSSGEQALWPREQPSPAVKEAGEGWNRELHSPHLILPLVLVVDKRLHDRWGVNTTVTQTKCREVGRRLSQLCSALGITVVLVGVEVWRQRDRVRLVPSADTTLARFLSYRHSKLSRSHTLFMIIPISIVQS